MEISIKVNEKEVELTEFPAKIITNVVIGILDSLRGVDEIGSAVIQLTADK